MAKIFAIGDIHGRLDKLQALMAKIDIDLGTDTLVFIGDYIDRGKHSYEVVQYLIDLKNRFQNIVFLKGNHEEMLEKYLSGYDKITYLVNGGQQALDSYMANCNEPTGPQIPREHLDFFGSLVLYYQTDDYIFVHAGLKEKIPLEMQKPEDLLWIRSSFIRSDYNFGKQVVFGHTPIPEPLVQPNKIGIDTGAVYGGKLTCVRLPDLVFYSV